jgi:hypothetical protein
MTHNRSRSWKGFSLVLYVSTILHLVHASPLISRIRLEQALVIGEHEDVIFQWTDVDTDSLENIYIADALDYSIKKFDKNGNLIKKTGRKGNGPGEFSDPRMLAINKDHIFLTQQSIPSISVFDTTLRFLYSIPFSAPIFDIHVINANKIILAAPSSNGYGCLTTIDTAGTILANHPIILDGHAGIMGFFRFSIDAENNYYAAFTFQNTILKLTPDGSTQWKTGLIDNLEQKTREVGKFMLPQNIYYKDIKLDRRGNIFVLSGQIKKDKGQEIFVLDDAGQLLSSFFLPQQTHLLHMDRYDHLYVRANMGTSLVKYRLYYE